MERLQVQVLETPVIPTEKSGKVIRAPTDMSRRDVYQC